MTAGERLVQLSGLSGVSAAAHLYAIAGIGGTAGSMLVAYAGPPPDDAGVLLMRDVGAPVANDSAFFLMAKRRGRR